MYTFHQTFKRNHGERDRMGKTLQGVMKQKQQMKRHLATLKLRHAVLILSGQSNKTQKPQLIIYKQINLSAVA